MENQIEARRTLHNAAGVAVQRVIETAAGMAFVTLIPRLMGPETFGVYSLLYSISMWFALLAGMGAVSMMVRFVPEFRQNGDEAGLRRLIGGLFMLRLLNGVGSAIAYFALASWWVGAVDALAVAIVAGSVAVRTAANLPYTLFLGLNQAARWSAAETLRRVLAVPIVAAGYALDGLIGSCWAILSIEVAVFALGWWWGRSYFSWQDVRLDRRFLAPFLRFSTAFMASNLLLVLFQQGGGPLLLLISGGVAEAGYYAIAFSAYLALTQAVWRLMNSFSPFFSLLLKKGDVTALIEWVERLLGVQATVAVLVAAGAASFAGPVVALVLGPAFEPVGPQLILMSLAAVSFGPAAIARILAVTGNHPRLIITSAAMQLISFGVLCRLLVPIDPNWGAALAALTASTIFAAHSAWGIREFVQFRLRPWATVLLLGTICSPLVWAWGGHPILRFTLFTGAFLLALRLAHAATLQQFVEIWRARRPVAEPDASISSK